MEDNHGAGHATFRLSGGFQQTWRTRFLAFLSSRTPILTPPTPLYNLPSASSSALSSLLAFPATPYFAVSCASPPTIREHLPVPRSRVLLRLPSSRLQLVSQ